MSRFRQVMMIFLLRAMMLIRITAKPHTLWVGSVCLLVILAGQKKAQQTCVYAAPLSRSKANHKLDSPDNKQVDKLKVIDPLPGQLFAPGDTVHVIVSLASGLKANDLKVHVIGVGILEGKNYNGKTYDTCFKIPDQTAGPLVLQPVITDTNNISISGAKTIISVRPRTAPTKIRFPQALHLLSPPPACITEQLHVIGTYHMLAIPPATIERDITSAASGTRYRSSNVSVVCVDSEGCCRIGQKGIAVITAENQGVKEFAIFVVEDPKHPLPPADLSNLIEIKKSSLRRQRGSSGYWTEVMLYVQDIHITNSSALPLIGPLYLVISSLSKATDLANMTGKSSSLPQECPYLQLNLPGDGLTLKPGESLNVSLQFAASSEKEIRYTPKLFRSSCQP